jgi:riboflavin synthase
LFTGLIADRGRVLAVERDGEGATLRIATALAAELGEGDSIAVDGVCLTAVDIVAGDPAACARARGHGEGEFAAQAMHETLQRSTLGALEPGEAVNLELALRADGRLGGHIVQGHVDGVATVAELRAEGFSRVLAFALDPELLPYIVEKGSIALNGVSLTVSALREDGFEVSLIPETLQRTTLGAAAAGERVNVEVDILAKHVQRLLGKS